MAYDKITLPGSGLVFNNVYSFDTSLYPGYKSEIIAAEHFFQEHFTNSIQLNIKFDLGTSQNGVALGTSGAVNGIDPGSRAMHCTAAVCRRPPLRSRLIRRPLRRPADWRSHLLRRPGKAAISPP